MELNNNDFFKGWNENKTLNKLFYIEKEKIMKINWDY